MSAAAPARRRTTPVPIGVLAAIGVAFLAIPLVGLLLTTPWSRLPELLTSPVAAEALRLSLITSLSATALAVLVGVPLAWVLARVSMAVLVATTSSPTSSKACSRYPTPPWALASLP